MTAQFTTLRTNAMETLHLILALAVTASSLGAGAWGAWRWWRVEPAPGFWPALRATQGLVVAMTVVGGWRMADGDLDADTLNVVYAVLPVVVLFIAEQLRLAAAQTVLDQRGLESAQEVGELPEAEQRSVVLAIVRRELGVMAGAALVVCLLALRIGELGASLPI